MHSRELNITEEQVIYWNTGTMIQKAFPNISADDREFLLTGSTPEEWDEDFPDE